MVSPKCIKCKPPGKHRLNLPWLIIGQSYPLTMECATCDPQTANDLTVSCPVEPSDTTTETAWNENMSADGGEIVNKKGQASSPLHLTTGCNV